MQLPLLPPATNKARLSAFVIFLCLALVLAGSGALYWRSLGRLQFKGMLQRRTQVIATEVNGVVENITVKEGQRVHNGQMLLHFDEQPLRAALAKERQEFAQRERMLPPRYVFLPDSGPDGAREESLSARLDRGKEEEENAQRLLQEASDQEAQASILYSRVAMLAAQGKISQGQRSVAETALAAAQSRKRAAQKHFEETSLKRSVVDMEIKRMREAQALSGANRLSEKARLTAYQEQLARVEELRAVLDKSRITAPADGVIFAVHVRPGDRLEAEEPCFLFQPEGSLPEIIAQIPAGLAQKLRQDQPCSITGAALGDKSVKGYIRTIQSAADTSMPPSQNASSPPQLTVEVHFIPEETAEHASFLGPAPLDKDRGVDVTVFLREPLYKRAAASVEHSPLPSQIPQEKAPSSSGSGAMQAPPPADQSLPAKPLTLKAGSSEALGNEPATGQEAAPPAEAPLSLPPMKAPYPLKSSPLPSRSNNPSIVPPQLLEPAETRP